MSEVLAYIASGVVAAWGLSHAIPTRQVLAGFGPISTDSRWIILQEWLAEAVTMWGLAAIVIVATAASGSAGEATPWIYRAVAGILVVLGVLTALTGARTRVIWFKICPVLLTSSAVLLLVASLI